MSWLPGYLDFLNVPSYLGGSGTTNVEDIDYGSPVWHGVPVGGDPGGYIWTGGITDIDPTFQIGLDRFFESGGINWDALAGLFGQGSLSGTPKWIEEIMTQEGGREWFEETVLPNILNQIKSQYPDFADQIDDFQDFINAGGNVEDWDSGGDTVAKQEAADFGQQILDATSIDQLAD